MITTPSGGQILLDKGFTTSPASPGRDAAGWASTCPPTAASTGRPAASKGLVNSKCLTRFNIDWVGRQVRHLQSRAMDDTGYVQPGYGQLRSAVRGTSRSITTTPSSPGKWSKAGR